MEYISPETKLGKIEGWNPEEFLSKDNRKTYSLTRNDKKVGSYTETELKKINVTKFLFNLSTSIKKI